jgi:hypothetical protein
VNKLFCISSHKTLLDLIVYQQKQNRNNAEPNSELIDEFDAVEAFKSCHTSSKNGLSEPAREAVVSPQIY